MSEPVERATAVRSSDGVGLWRRRLVEPLTGRAGPGLALVVAPAGCGKSTLLRHACSALPGPVAWYRVVADDSDPDAFVRHVGSALGDVLGQDGTAPVTAVDQLVDLLARRPGGGPVLVLDDLHEIAGSGAEPVLDQLLHLRPRCSRLLLGSRRPPRVNVSRLRVAEELVELGGDDLRFRTWEVERLFAEVYTAPLPPETAAELTRRTEGWAAGLQLFRLATAGRTSAQRREAVAALGGRSRLIRSYLSDNVLRGLPTARRSFLLRTCTLGLLTGALCDELLGTTGSQAVLRELEEEQLFTVSDDDGLTFRYHQVLQDHLEVTLQESLGDQGTKDWFHRSALVLERAGHVHDALRAHARSENWAAVSRLVSVAGPTVARHRADGWHGMLPAQLREHDPWLALAEAQHLLRQGAVERAVKAYRDAEEMSEDPVFQEQCRGERALAARWLPRPPPPAARRLDDAPDRRHWSERLRAATVHLPGRDPVDRRRPTAPGDRLVAGLVSVLAGRPAEGSAELLAVSDESAPQSLEHVAALSAQAFLELLQGGRPTARMEEASLAAGLAGQPWLERLTRASLGPALWPSADDSGVDGWPGLVRRCRADQDAWGAALLLLLRGVVGMLRQDDDSCSWLDEAAAELHGLGAPVLAVWAEAAGALDLRRRDPAGAAEAAARVQHLARLCGVPAAAHLATVTPAPRLAAAPTAGAATVEPEVGEVRLALLGGFRLEVDGRSMALPGLRPRALMLLRRLAVSVGADVHRESLVDALWPGSDAPTGTHKLQVAVSSLRHALSRAGLPGNRMLPRNGDAYRLWLPGAARVDVRDLASALARSAAARARGDHAAAAAAAREGLSLYRGDLLPEDGPAEWVVAEREHWRLRAAVAARELAGDCAVLGDLQGGIAAARRSLELDPFQDRPWELLAELHDRAGERLAAAHARTEHARVTAELATDSAPPSAVLPRSRTPVTFARR